MLAGWYSHAATNWQFFTTKQTTSCFNAEFIRGNLGFRICCWSYAPLNVVWLVTPVLRAVHLGLDGSGKRVIPSLYRAILSLFDPHWLKPIYWTLVLISPISTLISERGLCVLCGETSQLEVYVWTHVSVEKVRRTRAYFVSHVWPHHHGHTSMVTERSPVANRWERPGHHLMVTKAETESQHLKLFI